MRRRFVIPFLAALCLQAKEEPVPMPPKPQAPKNNECPVCHEMAPPYYRPVERKPAQNCKPVPGDYSSYTCEFPEVPAGPVVNLVRCKRCNAAFFQDAEARPVK